MFIIALQVLYITFLLNAHVTLLLLTVFHINYYMCYNIAWWTTKTERMVGHVVPSNVATVNVITHVKVENK